MLEERGVIGAGSGAKAREVIGAEVWSLPTGETGIEHEVNEENTEERM